MSRVLWHLWGQLGSQKPTPVPCRSLVLQLASWAVSVWVAVPCQLGQDTSQDSWPFLHNDFTRLLDLVALQQLTIVGTAAPPSGHGRHSHQAQCLQDSQGLSPKIGGAVSARPGVKDVFEEAVVFSDASSLRGAGRASTLLSFFCWEIIFLLACKQEL